MYASVIRNTFSQLPNLKYTTVNNIKFVALVPLHQYAVHL